VGAVTSERVQGARAQHERVRGERSGPMRVHSPPARPGCARRGHIRRRARRAVQQWSLQCERILLDNTALEVALKTKHIRKKLQSSCTVDA
jgi:hypothetical protein